MIERARPSDTAEALLVVEDISKRYPSAYGMTTILEDVSFAVPRGGLFAINGPQGSGKSTLLHILSGLDRPSAGSITLAGQVISDRSQRMLPRWRWSQVGVILQRDHLVSTLSVGENVLLAIEFVQQVPRKQRRERIAGCLRALSLEHRAESFPAELTVVEQRLAAIARSLANDPALILADDPAGSLEGTPAAGILDALDGLVSQGKTVVFTTSHEAATDRAANSIVLAGGRIIDRSYGATPGLYG